MLALLPRAVLSIQYFQPGLKGEGAQLPFAGLTRSYHHGMPHALDVSDR